MSARREELNRIAARLFAERGYQGTSLADLAAGLDVLEKCLLIPRNLDRCHAAPPSERSLGFAL